MLGKGKKYFDNLETNWFMRNMEDSTGKVKNNVQTAVKKDKVLSSHKW